MSTTIVQSLTFVIFIVFQKIRVKVFAAYRELAGLTLIITHAHILDVRGKQKHFCCVNIDSTTTQHNQTYHNQTLPANGNS